MKVLKNNYNKVSAYETHIKTNPYPRKIECERCGSELEYEESDLRIGFLGCVFVDCPLCGCDNLIEDNEHELTLTEDNVEFPTHFSCTSKETGAVETCTNEHIKECIHRAIKYFREYKDEVIWFTQTGDTRVTVYRWSDDEIYEVFVTNRFYTTEIQFEEVDYE